MTWQQRRDLEAMLQKEAHEPEPLPIEQLREGFAAMMAQFPAPEDVRSTPTELGGRPALRVEPEGEPRPGTILYLHGGSWVLGSPATGFVNTANLVTRTRVAAISLDYRLAPEHPFPAAVDDCLAAYRALLDAGTDPATIVFAGDSAGGGLSVSTCLAARAAGLPQPAAIVAFSPGVDLTRAGASMVTRQDRDPYFTREGFGHTTAMYLGDQDPAQPLLSPAVYADLTGLPPMLLQVGTNELLLDDAVRLAARATEADVDVILDVTAAVPHVFQAFGPALDEAGRALDRAALFISQHLGVSAAR
ncbi:alpha/beta hydrolase [Catenulispora pinisilvae]|uniref:alpha/beta hydrolase n=1 Tax=Catenulispora pinisilvae TaxID=2705253 RepID=UPI001891AA4B|nr:alpha/beta hydrolase [Catenulispora pinisilvae]